MCQFEVRDSLGSSSWFNNTDGPTDSEIGYNSGHLKIYFDLDLNQKVKRLQALNQASACTELLHGNPHKRAS